MATPRKPTPRTATKKTAAKKSVATQPKKTAAPASDFGYDKLDRPEV